jgi:transcriptional regulator with XRE-family HTH domain
VIAQRPRYLASAALRLRDILGDEFSRRRRINPRYSLRAFARSVRIEHSTLSQLLRGKRPLTWKSIDRIATTMRWTGAAVLQSSTQSSEFDSRSIARQLGISVDEVNVALTDLCLFGLVELRMKTELKGK